MKTQQQIEHEECLALADFLGGAFARRIAPTAIVENWSVARLDAAIQKVVAECRVSLLENGANELAADAAVSVMYAALVRSRKQIATLMAETEGNA